MHVEFVDDEQLGEFNYSSLSSSSYDDLLLLQQFELENRSEIESLPPHCTNQLIPTDGSPYCNATFDRILCWPITLAGTTSVASCPSELNGVKYDASKSASRHCYLNASWDVYSNYSQCRPLEDYPSGEPFHDTDATSLIYFVGYSFSLVAVILALFIFLYFKDLRCLRNTFHANLLTTYLLLDLTWIITASLHDQSHMSQCAMMVILYYFQGTNFFWMFVEGFYLYMLVVRTFTADKIKFKLYIFFGWGFPLIAVSIWAIVKMKLTNPASGTASTQCPWLVKDVYDWIFNSPILAVLVVNLIFLGNVMYVLITKLRAATSAESQQYRKATKALLVLIPLLGITYIIVLVAPPEGLVAKVLAYLRAILLSTQGLTVSILYCFLNGEVRNTLRHHLNNWRTEHNLGGGGGDSRSRHRNGSLRSRTESIRLYSAVNNTECRCGGSDDVLHHQVSKEKCASCLLTTTTTTSSSMQGLCCTNENGVANNKSNGSSS